MASASVRCLMKPPTMASTSSRRFTRSVLVLKPGSWFRSSRPMARKSRSVMAWAEAEIATPPPPPVARGVPVAGGGAFGGAAHALAHLARELVDGGLGAEDREDRFEQAQVDDLAAAAVNLDAPHRDHRGHGPGEPRDHVGHGEGREHGLAIVEPVAWGEGRQGLDEGAQTRGLRG